MPLEVEIFPCRSDNYGYLAHDNETGRTASIDAPDEGAVREALRRRGWNLTEILVTHHHIDHVEGIEGLKAEFGCRVAGPDYEAGKIPGIDVALKGGDRIRLGNVTFNVHDAPGHTLGHIVYHDPSGGHLFTGDALFSLGCGRMFEGTPGPMWAGLASLKALPPETRIYCGHEYTEANARFALSVDPNNEALKQRAQEVARLREEGRPTIPVTLGLEKKTNPFLRADRPELARAVGLDGSDHVAVFAALRKAKDNF